MRSGLFALLLIMAAAALGPLFSADPTAPALERGLESPSAGHVFGTDPLGRDVFARVLEGMRISLAIGAAATAVSIVLGIAVGAAAGYFGGRTDTLLMAGVDVLYGLPYIVFVVVLMVIVGRSLANIFVAIGAVSWLTTARIVRAEVRSLRAREFVLAARALGAGHARVIAVHIVPNLLGIVIVHAALTVPLAIRQEALLSFLGLGVEPPAASLGSLLRDGLGVLSPGHVEWWLLAFPALALVAIVAAFNAVADGLRDRLDPRTARRGRA